MPVEWSLRSSENDKANDVNQTGQGQRDGLERSKSIVSYRSMLSSPPLEARHLDGATRQNANTLDLRMNDA
jgi:hypothetical protein